ncbi:helix-turn-helix domain-containing protein [Aeromonas veronii]|uniref:helix-turn-helix domain-containing protein n=1 Tax=Aeromonas veronii TaxID=654 RepID=UPI00366BBCAD
MTTRFGSFSDVARRQDMTPSSVSRKMAQLEEKVAPSCCTAIPAPSPSPRRGSLLPNSAPRSSSSMSGWLARSSNGRIPREAPSGSARRSPLAGCTSPPI